MFPSWGRRGGQSGETFCVSDHPEGVNELQGRVFPSWNRRGGCAIKKMLRSLLMKAQTGWSVPDNVSTSNIYHNDHPVCAASEASRLFLTGAATPPVPGGEHPVLQFIQTFIERRYSCSNRVFRSARCVALVGTSLRFRNPEGTVLYSFGCECIYPSVPVCSEGP